MCSNKKEKATRQDDESTPSNDDDEIMSCLSLRASTNADDRFECYCCVTTGIISSALFTTRRQPESLQQQQQCSTQSYINLRAILFGQGIALLATSVNASSFTLEHHFHVVLPLFNMMITYILLSSMHLLYQWNRQRHEQTREEISHNLLLLGLRLRLPVYSYLLISLLDVSSNYMTLLSFQYGSNLTSTTLLGSLTIPSTMLCCRILLRARYRGAHYVGALLCIVGGSITVWSDNTDTTTESTTDITSSLSQDSTHLYIGDLLALSAALLYGLSDAVAEYQVKYMDRVEYLGMLGLFGSVFCAFLMIWVGEYNELLRLLLNDLPSGAVQWQVFVTMLWYICSLVLYYTCACYFLEQSDAALLNLSLQSCSLWAILFSVVVSRMAAPSIVFYIAVLLVISGVFVYELLGTKKHSGEKRASCCESDEETELMLGRHRDDDDDQGEEATRPSYEYESI